MALSEGQQIALAQLQRIASIDGSPIRIIGIDDDLVAGHCLNVDISLDCTHYERVEGGLPLHNREGVTLSVPADFPFSPPSLDTAHTRFHGFGHVQWGRHLCVYQSTETQWIPSQGMFGFLAQLDEWFRRGARNELDHPEGPLHPPVAYRVAATSICVNADTPGRDTWPWVGSLLPGLRNTCDAVSRWSWPFRRRYSRTHVLADAIADVIGTQACNAPTRQAKSIVFNACELRTGTAFRMSNIRFGCWRYGWAPSKELRVADAVTASAAYPPFLPPFDWIRPFELNGKTDTRRVIVTDGGVFENLGVSVMEPGRDAQISAIGYHPDIIIASDAGAGQFTGESLPISWPKRMTQVVSAVMRKVQDATKQRLHDHAKAGRIDGFVYVSLGQIDERVPLKPANWVDRGDVIRYPTDFSVMSDSDIRRLSGRGEAITRALVTQYLLSD